MCRTIHAEFVAAAEKLGSAEYDVWDLDDQVCSKNIQGFKAQTKEIDKRLAALILQVALCH